MGNTAEAIFLRSFFLWSFTLIYIYSSISVLHTLPSPELYVYNKHLKNQHWRKNLTLYFFLVPFFFFLFLFFYCCYCLFLVYRNDRHICKTFVPISERNDFSQLTVVLLKSSYLFFVKCYGTTIETDVHSDDTWLSLEIKICASGPQNDGSSNQLILVSFFQINEFVT